MLFVAAAAGGVTSVVLWVRLAVTRWSVEEACRNAYHRGKREGWYEAMRLVPGHGDSYNRSKADSIWN